MDIKKVDRRVKYTKMVIKDSFIKLLKKKNVSKITIKEICEMSDINRTTFYAHYADQYDLLQQLEEELINDINNYLGMDSYGNLGYESLDMLTKIFEYIKENADICSILLSDRGDLAFQKQVMHIVEKQFISEWTTIGALKKEDAEYIYAFTVIGSIGLIQKWLNDGMVKSAREMAEMIIKLTFKDASIFYKNEE